MSSTKGAVVIRVKRKRTDDVVADALMVINKHPRLHEVAEQFNTISVDNNNIINGDGNDGNDDDGKAPTSTQSTLFQRFTTVSAQELCDPRTVMLLKRTAETLTHRSALVQRMHKRTFVGRTMATERRVDQRQLQQHARRYHLLQAARVADASVQAPANDDDTGGGGVGGDMLCDGLTVIDMAADGVDTVANTSMHGIDNEDDDDNDNNDDDGNGNSDGKSNTDDGFVYDLYYYTPGGDPDDKTHTYVDITGLVNVDDFFEDEDVDVAMQMDDADSDDSNAEDYYMNDYPDEDEGDDSDSAYDGYRNDNDDDDDGDEVGRYEQENLDEYDLEL